MARPTTRWLAPPRSAAAGVATRAWRNDGHPLAPVAMARGGVLFEVKNGASAKSYRKVLSPLVRPTRIWGPGTSENTGLVFESELEEGHGFRTMQILENAPWTITLQGWVWSRRWSVTLEPDDDTSRSVLPALVFGSSLKDDLTDEESLLAAQAGMAVTEHTAYLAEIEDAHATKGGLSMDLHGHGSLGFYGSGSCGCHMGHVGSTTLGPLSDLGPALAQLVIEATTHCLVEAAGSTRVLVETTGLEIAHVQVQESDSPVTRHCVEEAIWAARLDDEFESRHVTAVVPL